MYLTIFMDTCMAVGAYLLSDGLIGSRKMKDSFIKAGLSGKDLSKTSEDRVPEGLGVICGAVYLISMFLFIPIPFLPSLIPETETPFKHHEFAQFICALLSICCMIFLGFADDVLDLRWRHKVLLPTIASLPLLMVYWVNGGSTFVLLPKPVRFLLGSQLNLGVLYFVYMGMLAVFCTNAINILAGINGIEVGQSLVIGVSVLLFNFIELPGHWGAKHAFSVYLLLPFIAVSAALFKHNKYPSRVFVGDTYCYFAGMTFAVVAILGHFSKTVMLFFIPQVLNFLYSIPQLFGLVPCPRHRLPKFNRTSGLLGMSYAQFKPDQLRRGGGPLLKLLRMLRLVAVETGVGENKDEIRVNNLTLINFVILWVGPQREDRLTTIMLAIQVFFTLVAFSIRYGLARFFYDVV